MLLSVPFPGSVYAAFRIAQAIKAHDPAIVTVLGGGFVNTELRELSEPRVFDYFDFVTLDDGERPLLALLEHLAGQRPRQQPGAHLRAPRRTARCATSTPANPTFPSPRSARRPGTACRWTATCRCSTCSTRCTGCGRDGRWNKLTVAHGCYWKKCSFCDVSLDYIGRYDGAPAATAGRPHRSHHRRDRPDRLSLRRRSRAAQGAARRWPTNCSGATGRSPGGATSASKSPSPRSCASSWPTAAASPSPAGWKSPPTACSS